MESVNGGPSPCHLCEKEVFIACPHCNEFLCHQHCDTCDCRGKLQIVEKNKCAVNIFQAYASTFLRLVFSSFFSLEALNKLSLDRKWHDYITKNGLWKRFCHYPKSYWEDNWSYAVSKKQHFSPFSKWKYNIDCECLLIENWENGVAEVKKLNLVCKKIIKLARVFIDSFGKHWLFLTDGVTLDVYDIRTIPGRFHARRAIIRIPEEYIRLNTDIVLSNEKLFVICGNFIQAFEFCHPDYILTNLYRLICDMHKKIENLDYPITVNVAFRVHILAKAIIGHAIDISTGIIYIHVWNPATGIKILVDDLPLVDASEMSSGRVESEVCPLEHYAIFNASIYLNNKIINAYLIVTNFIQTVREDLGCHDPASVSLIDSNFRDSELNTFIIERQKNIVFCKKISKDIVIVCRKIKKHLVFNVLKMTGGQKEVCPPFDVPLSKNVLNPSFKIHLFRGIREKNGLLCVAVERKKIEIIDLKRTIVQKHKVSKFLCRVECLDKLCFVNPKFVLILFDKHKIDIGELWDAEEGQPIGQIITNKFVHGARATWYDLLDAPPSKLIFYNEQSLYIVDFEVYY